jgi:hypothetical protein
MNDIHSILRIAFKAFTSCILKELLLIYSLKKFKFIELLRRKTFKIKIRDDKSLNDFQTHYYLFIKLSKHRESY